MEEKMEYLLGFFTLNSLGWLVGCGLGLAAVYIISDLTVQAGESSEDDAPLVFHGLSAVVHLIITVVSALSCCLYAPWISAVFIVLHLLLIRHWLIRHNRKKR